MHAITSLLNEYQVSKTYQLFERRVNPYGQNNNVFKIEELIG